MVAVYTSVLMLWLCVSGVHYSIKRYYRSAFNKTQKKKHFLPISGFLSPELFNFHHKSIRYRQLQNKLTHKIFILFFSSGGSQNEINTREAITVTEWNKILRHMYSYKCMQGSPSCFYTKQSYGWPPDFRDIRNHTVDLVATGHFGFMKGLNFFVLFKKSLIYTKFKKVTSF